MSYENYDLIINENVIGDFGNDVTFSIVNEDDDLLYISYYGQQEHFDKFATTYRSTIDTAILNILAGDPSNQYSVLFTDVTNITFTTTDANSNDTFDQGENVGEIVFGQSLASHSGFEDPNTGQLNPAAAAFTYGASTTAEQGDIWINSQHESATWGSSVNVWEDTASIVSGTHAYLALVHEIGHSLGLNHADGTAIDDQKYTIMNGEPMTEMIDTNSLANSVAPAGLQLFDIAALQSEYGRNYTTRNEDTTYSAGLGFGGNPATPFIYTIWDGGGIDDINASNYADAVIIDLRQGHFSSIGKAVDEEYEGARGEGLADENVAIAFHTVIENAMGTNDTGDGDILIGNAWKNELKGLQGDDKLYGDGLVRDGQAGFTDVDEGENGNPDGPAPESDDDILIPGTGADESYGGYGDDTFIATGAVDGLEGDLYHGGGFLGGGSDPQDEIAYGQDGSDTVDYSTIAYGLTIDISDPSAGWAERTTGGVQTEDILVSIENVRGTHEDDDITGSAGNNVFYGTWGTDNYDGGAGASDVLDYRYHLSGTTSGVEVHFSSSGASIEKYAAGTANLFDTATNVEIISGSNMNDWFFGSQQNYSVSAVPQPSWSEG